MTTKRKEHARLLDKLEKRNARIAVIGLGYVGLPISFAALHAGFTVLGLDTDPAKIESLTRGDSYIAAVDDSDVQKFMGEGKFEVSIDFTALETCDVIIICVPTPLTKNREPDLSFVSQTTMTVLDTLRSGQLVVLESTTYPGTTEQVLKPILESGGLRSGIDFWLGFSPEREDPGNAGYSTPKIPKIVSGDGDEAAALVQALYATMVDEVVSVSTPATAEAVKLTENIFRAVNIALVNELKVIYSEMGIDVWEIIEAASTKPFGYMPFYPGPGLGGHCIPIDPFYLTWKAREFGVNTRFIELAGEINVSMPKYVVGNLEKELDRRLKKSLGASRILIIGVAYKKNVADLRESPALKIIRLLEERGAHVDFHDPHVAEIWATRDHPELTGRKSVELSEASLKTYDAALIVTDHDDVDYQAIADFAPIIVDTRNAMRNRDIERSDVLLT